MIKIRKRSWILLIIINTLFFSALPYSSVKAISAASAIVMDVQSGRVLYHQNINSKKPMASTTKIMTALVALENSKLDDIVKIHKNAVGIEGSSIYLGYDEKVKMEDLLYGLMLRSGNDSAVAIAIHVGGSIESFVKMMNEKAKEIGAHNTNFTNPHGLHHDNHYTTAYDLALITREALKNPQFKKIVSTKLWVSEREGFKYFYNKNKALVELEGGNGVKTGYTKASGRCLVTSATRNGMQLVAVVLDDPNWFADSYQLLNNAFNTYEAYRVFKEGDVVKRIFVDGGKKHSTGICANENVVIPLTQEEQQKIFTILDVKEQTTAPVSRGSKAGKAKIYLDKKLLYTVELVYREDIAEKTIIDKIFNFRNN